jgi:hypothetical protein
MDKFAGPSITEEGNISFKNDPWGKRTSFLISPEGEIYHYDSDSGSHGQALMAIEAEGMTIHEMPEDWIEEYETHKGLGQQAFYRAVEGWAVGLVNDDEITIMADDLSPDQVYTLSGMVGGMDFKTVNIELEGMGEMKSLPKKEFLSLVGNEVHADFDQDVNLDYNENNLGYQYQEMPLYEDPYIKDFETYNEYNLDREILHGPGPKAGDMVIYDNGRKFVLYVLEEDIIFGNDEWTEVDQYDDFESAQKETIKGREYGHNGHVWFFDKNNGQLMTAYASGKKDPDKRKKRRKRHRNKYRSTVPYYGHWWVGITNPDHVVDHGEGHSGGGTTENSGGGDFGGGMGSVTAAGSPAMQERARAALEEAGVQNQPVGTPFERWIFIEGQWFFWDSTGFVTGDSRPLYHNRVINYLSQAGIIDFDMMEDEEDFCYGYYDRGGLKGPAEWIEWFGNTPDEALIEQIKTLMPNAIKIWLPWNYDPALVDGTIDLKQEPTVASIREAVFVEAERSIGYLRCFWCRQNAEDVDLTVDKYHLEKEASVDNLVPCCHECQRDRGDKTPEEMFQENNVFLTL